MGTQYHQWFECFVLISQSVDNCLVRILNFADTRIEAAARSAAEVLRAGGVVLYPTDTLYGLGVDALSDEAVAKIYGIKGREEKKPIHAIVADTAMTERFAVINASAQVLAKEFWPGPLTLILKKHADVNTGIAHGLETFGARAADNPFCMALAQEFGGPYTGTSANRSGEKPQCSVGAILEQLGDVQIDLVVDAGELPPSAPSTVVDLSSEKPEILREGTISASKILEIAENAAQQSRL